MTDEMASRLAEAQAKFESAKCDAMRARAHVAALKVLVEAARAAWAAAHNKANPAVALLPEDPEVEWSEPKTEEEAEADLEVARLGGELTAASLALDSAKRKAREATTLTMKQAAWLGRLQWASRN